MKIRTLAVTFCCTLLGAGRHVLSIDEGRQLVRSALPKETLKLPGLGIEADPNKTGRCVTFDVLWANPGIGSAHVDFYNVDLRTAAIWRTAFCAPVKTIKVVRLQREFRKLLGVSDSEYQEAMDRGSCCVWGKHSAVKCTTQPILAKKE